MAARKAELTPRVPRLEPVRFETLTPGSGDSGAKGPVEPAVAPVKEKVLRVAAFENGAATRNASAAARKGSQVAVTNGDGAVFMVVQSRHRRHADRAEPTPDYDPGSANNVPAVPPILKRSCRFFGQMGENDC